MKHGVLIEAGDAFFDGEAPLLNYFRLAYSAISSERIPEGVGRLAAVMREVTALTGKSNVTRDKTS